MPRASTSSSSYSERVSNNQKRSRQRKKDYLASLEARLRTYEQDGVQASVELQRKARLVNQENKALRNLLRDLGVDDALVQHYTTAATSDCSQNGTAGRSVASCSSGVCTSNTSPCTDSSTSSSTVLEYGPLATQFDLVSGRETDEVRPLEQSSSLDVASTAEPTLAPNCCDVGTTSGTEEGIGLLLCRMFCMPTSTVDPNGSFTYTPCPIALSFLFSLNQKRALPFNLFDAPFSGLWSACRLPLDSAFPCVIDDDTLFSAAKLLVAV